MKKIRVRKYRPFLMKWMSRPDVKEWISYKSAIVASPQGAPMKMKKAYCRYCDKTMANDITDLVKHGQSSIHLAKKAESSGHTYTAPEQLEKIVDSEDESDEDFAPIEEAMVEEEVGLDDAPFSNISLDGEPLPVIDSPTLFVNASRLRKERRAEANTKAAMERCQLALMNVELRQQEVRLYLVKLEALEKEQAMGLPRSQFTADL